METEAIKKRLLSVAIPYYNRKEVISWTIKQLKAFCSELIFVNDFCKLLKSYASEDSRVKLINI
jgi:dolichol-phosphate mannosyltransferase